MIKKVITSFAILTLATSCVSKKIYTDLENKYADLKKENRTITDANENLLKDKNQLELDQKTLTAERDRLKTERDKLLADYQAAEKNLKTLQNSYNALEKNSDESLKTNLDKNRELLAKLEAKEKALAAEQDRLNKLKNDLQASSNRLTELENYIASKDAAMKKLKENISKALNAFEGKGLTVEQRNGKVYVSMENKLLFGTGSWTVGAEGKKAVVELGKVLADNPEISVLIEGHTDNDKILGNIGGAIVNILAENKTIDRKNLTAAGRGEFAPLSGNETNEGKAKNRRIEVILTPKLDEISKMLNDF
jgi:chemotaxis protein MotB